MRLNRIGVIVLAFTVGVGLPNITYAMELQKQTVVDGNYHVISPFWNAISSIIPNISAEDTTIYPEVYVEAKSSQGSISGTMYLEKQVNGQWIVVTSWSFSGTMKASSSKSYKGTMGAKYRTRVVVTVDGEKAEATSRTCTI